MNMTKNLILLIAAFMLNINLAAGQALPEEKTITSLSSFGVEETLDRLRASLQDLGINLVAEVDHAKAAADKGLKLRPTHLLIFGNPLVGTSLMQADQRTGLELPLKLLVWQDENGQVYLSYHQPNDLKRDYKLSEQQAVLDKMGKVYEQLKQAVEK
ncbi:DUF302 domain-containing protein [Pontibacter roseus]|uniref:DUF302 domain-containing protein n=1 Tax=Pontibacter roseus TaxID=336989 RepID=UPI000367607B|nr:DUF302 domain-containing protein [Pontibacter roseus]